MQTFLLLLMLLPMGRGGSRVEVKYRITYEFPEDHITIVYDWFNWEKGKG